MSAQFASGAQPLPTPAIFADCTDGGALGRSAELVPVDLAMRRGLALAEPVEETEALALEQCLGRVLAQDLTAPCPQPLFDNSAMDGYAIRLADLAGDGPWRLPVGGKLAAGDSATEVTAETACALRILTGAPVPCSFDAVVMQERVVLDGEAVIVKTKPRRGENIRRCGEDVAAGQKILKDGDLLGARPIALAAATGHAFLQVRRKVRVAFFSTGSELREPGEVLQDGQIYNSNRYLLRCLLSAPFIDLQDMGNVVDDPARLAAQLSAAAASCDVVISTGGVSVGDADHMPRLVGEAGGALSIVKVAMKPGKPVTVGKLGATIYVGLPGNPVAAFVTYLLIARPIIERCAGLSSPRMAAFSAVAGFTRRRHPWRREYLPVAQRGVDSAGQPLLDLLGHGSSAALLPLAQASGLGIVEPGGAAIEPGMAMTYIPLATLNA